MVLVLAIAGVQACVPPRPRSHPTALGELWHIHQAVRSFAAERGRLPTSEELHDESFGARYVGAGGLSDSWARAIRYRLVPGEYELRSAGPDGVFENADDLVFVPSRWQAQIGAFVGCYAVSLEWAPGFPGQRLVLDTVDGRQRVRPSLTSGRPGGWSPAGDSVIIAWDGGPHAHDTQLELRLRTAGDSLVGTGRARRGAPRPVVAVRSAAC
jgi:hypothetical protein